MYRQARIVEGACNRDSKPRSYRRMEASNGSENVRSTSTNHQSRPPTQGKEAARPLVIVVCRLSDGSPDIAD
jgi:hypothetical protein